MNTVFTRSWKLNRGNTSHSSTLSDHRRKQALLVEPCYAVLCPSFCALCKFCKTLVCNSKLFNAIALACSLRQQITSAESRRRKYVSGDAMPTGKQHVFGKTRKHSCKLVLLAFSLAPDTSKNNVSVAVIETSSRRTHASVRS